VLVSKDDYEGVVDKIRSVEQRVEMGEGDLAI
jgi:tetrahydromethanopterin S-methyltransferase subunit G